MTRHLLLAVSLLLAGALVACVPVSSVFISIDVTGKDSYATLLEIESMLYQVRFSPGTYPDNVKRPPYRQFDGEWFGTFYSSVSTDLKAEVRLTPNKGLLRIAVVESMSKQMSESAKSDAARFVALLRARFGAEKVSVEWSDQSMGSIYRQSNPALNTDAVRPQRAG
jgi:hypothetical protein